MCHTCSGLVVLEKYLIIALDSNRTLEKLVPRMSNIKP